MLRARSVQAWTHGILAAVLGSGLCLGSEALKMREGFAFVEAEINGRGPFRLLIDTGTVPCILTPQAAARAGIQPDHRIVLATLAGERIFPGSSQNALRIGAVTQPGIQIVTDSLGPILELDPKADGMLGQSFLGRQPYLIDYRHKRLLLGDEAREQAQRLPVAVESYNHYGRPVVPVLLDPYDDTRHLTLDSGAISLVIECQNHCPALHQIEHSENILTLVGERAASRGVLFRMRIGGLTFFRSDAILVKGSPADDRNEGVLPTRLFSAVYVDSGIVRFAR